MKRFNTQTAELATNFKLCKQIYDGYLAGQSIRHIAIKHDISDYAARKIAKHMQEKEDRTGVVRS